MTRHDLAKDPPPRELLEQLIDEYGIDQVMNRRSPAFKALGGRKLSKREALDLMQQDVNLIRRPLLVRGRKAWFGFDAAAYDELARE